jgi:hypothetical protein
MSLWLCYDEDYVKTQFGRNNPKPKTKPDDPADQYRDWSRSKIDTSGEPWYARLGYKIAGDHFVRTPGKYVVINKETGKPTSDPLEDT